MNRINLLFANKKNNILNIYFTAGHPHLEDTVAIIQSLTEAGADLVEIGMPYSDPLADGPTIQASSAQALRNGMNLGLLFNQIKDARTKSSIPFIMMGYFNQLMQYGIERFMAKAKDSGVDGMIIPDLPVEEFEKHYKELFDRYDMNISFLITPQTPEARIRHIDAVSNSFIYMVSSNAITGAKSNIDAEQEEYFTRIEHMKLKNPRLIGFGISNKTTFDKACGFAQGAIIGSAFIQTLDKAKQDEIKTKVNQFISSVRNGSPA